MLTRTAILIPSYQRPDAVRRVISSLCSTDAGAPWSAYIIAEGDDFAVCSAALDVGVNCILNKGAASYAGAINTGYRETPEPLLFMAADDLAFTDGWLGTLLAAVEANPTAQVFGTNDLGNPDVLNGSHATHYLIRRSYADNPGACVSGPQSVLWEGYQHNFTDTELIETAKSRGVFVPVLDSVVEHLHPAWHKAAWDSTYEKMLAGNSADGREFQARCHLWTR